MAAVAVNGGVDVVCVADDGGVDVAHVADDGGASSLVLCGDDIISSGISDLSPSIDAIESFISFIDSSSLCDQITTDSLSDMEMDSMYFSLPCISPQHLIHLCLRLFPLHSLDLLICPSLHLHTQRLLLSPTLQFGTLPWIANDRVLQKWALLKKSSSQRVKRLLV